MSRDCSLPRSARKGGKCAAHSGSPVANYCCSQSRLARVGGAATGGKNLPVSLAEAQDRRNGIAISGMRERVGAGGCLDDCTKSEQRESDYTERGEVPWMKLRIVDSDYHPLISPRRPPLLAASVDGRWVRGLDRHRCGAKGVTKPDIAILDFSSGYEWPPPARSPACGEGSRAGVVVRPARFLTVCGRCAGGSARAGVEERCGPRSAGSVEAVAKKRPFLRPDV